MTGVRWKATLAMDILREMLMVEKKNSTRSEAEPSSKVRRLIDKTLASVSVSSLVLRSEAVYSVGILLANALF